LGLTRADVEKLLNGDALILELDTVLRLQVPIAGHMVIVAGESDEALAEMILSNLDPEAPITVGGRSGNGFDVNLRDVVFALGAERAIGLLMGQGEPMTSAEHERIRVMSDAAGRRQV